MRISINAPLFAQDIDLKEAYKFWKNRNDESIEQFVRSVTEEDQMANESDSDDSTNDLFVTVQRKPRKRKRAKRANIVDTVSDSPEVNAEFVQSNIEQHQELPAQQTIQSSSIADSPTPIIHTHLTRRANVVAVDESDDTVITETRHILRISKESKPTAKRRMITVDWMNVLGGVLHTRQYDEVAGFWTEDEAHMRLLKKWRDKHPVINQVHLMEE
jgi:hypothetical protein